MVRKVELQSLVGHLQHAAKVVRLGRCFVRHPYKLSETRQGANQMIRLNVQARGDRVVVAVQSHLLLSGTQGKKYQTIQFSATPVAHGLWSAMGMALAIAPVAAQC